MAQRVEFHVGGFKPAALQQNRSEVYDGAGNTYTRWDAAGAQVERRALTTAEAAVLTAQDTDLARMLNDSTLRADAVTAMTETINMEECMNGIRACAICPAEVATPIMDRRPVPPSAEDRSRMLQPEDLGNTIRFIAELPAHACINQLIISPTWNRMYIDNL